MPDLLDRLKAALADRYAIEREIGAGGMATVYLAEDLKHKRKVAVKVLKPELSAAVGAERFLQEIRVTANLHHPHILPLFDSGEADGFLYYVMPYVEGESLRNRLNREGQLPIEEALRLAREIAAALSYAHSLDIVHRDIKPDNVLLLHGEAVVADFGIARAITTAGGGKLTATGFPIGTPTYMSPEQASGKSELDGRSDIYSLACVLYEMLVGEPPFTGPNAQGIMARHAIEAVPGIRVIRSTVPDYIEGAINKALAKVPADRFGTPTLFAEALAGIVVDAEFAGSGKDRTHRGRWFRVVQLAALSALVVAVAWGVTRAWRLLPHQPGALTMAGCTSWLDCSPRDLDPRNVAVLYFGSDRAKRDVPDAHFGLPSPAVSRSYQFEFSFFADLLTEEISEHLSSVSGLSVRQPDAVRLYQAGPAAADTVARLLSAGTLIVGEVTTDTEVVLGSRVGTEVRVTLGLVNGETGKEISRTTIDGNAADLLAVRDQTLQRTLDLLRGWFGEDLPLASDQRVPTTSGPAWVLSALAEQGRREAGVRVSKGERRRAISLLRAADSRLARAEQLDSTWSHPPARRAIVADWLGQLEQNDAVVDSILLGGVGHAERALRINSANTEALAWRGILKYMRGLVALQSSDTTLADAMFVDAWVDFFPNQRPMSTSISRMRPLVLDLSSHLIYHAKSAWLEGLEGDSVAPWRAIRRLNNRLVLYVAGSDHGQACQSPMELAGVVFDGPAPSVFPDVLRRTFSARCGFADQVLWRSFAASYDAESIFWARQSCDEGFARFPDDWRFRECRLWMWTLEEAPDLERAGQILSNINGMTVDAAPQIQTLRASLILSALLAGAGRADSARALIEFVRARRSPQVELIAMEAFARTQLGDDDEAVDLLDQWVDMNESARLHLVDGELHWWWRDLQDHPRFEQLLHRTMERNIQ